MPVPSSSEQLASLMMSFGAGGVAIVIGALPLAVGVAIYWTRMSYQAKLDRMEHEVAKGSEKIAKLNQHLEDLGSRHQQLLQVGALVFTTVQQIASDLAEVAAHVDATNHSILVPAPTTIPGDEPDQLVFLCLSGPQAATLRWVRVPIGRSAAGDAFRSRKPVLTQRPAKDGFSSKTDHISDFKTEEILSVPLVHKGYCVGVAQFLNKRNSGRFTTDDIEQAVIWSATLARKVADFVEDPRRLAALGHAPRQNRVRAVILFADISNFASLFYDQDASLVTDLVNQFFQELGNVGLKHRGVIDQFLGDGFMMTFNAVQELEKPAECAVAAASEMIESFRKMRERWTTIGYVGVEKIFARIGLELGPVTRGEVGHSQHRRMTVMGAAVNSAAHLCDAGPRDRNIVLIGPDIRSEVGARILVKRFGRPGQPERFELTGLC